MKYNLFLDDFRSLSDAFAYLPLPEYLQKEWIIVRNYDDFVYTVEKHGIPEMVSFDHDLGIDDCENWKDVKGYEGVYMVSDLGRVVRIKKSKGTSGNNVLSPQKNESGLYVKLRNSGDDISKKVHRLVAEAFIPNPKNKPQINHKDGNRWNNRWDNLEWATQSENVEHSHNNLDREYSAYGENHSNSKSISQYDKNGELIDVYGSVNEAGRQLNIPFTNIAKCARGERKSAGGFIWKYENKPTTKFSKTKHIKKDEKDYSERFFIPSTFTEKTGYDCARWLINHCLDLNVPIPERIIIHSMNRVGAENIKSLFDTYNKLYSNGST
jgi:hypothetical protein